MNKITVSVVLNSDIQTAWDCYTQAGHITKWNFASDDWHCPSAENDLRPGGNMKSRMEAKDGSFGFDFEAVYDEVANLQKIAYTMPDGRKVATIFEQAEDKTHIMTTFDAENENPIEMQREGWQAILNNFKKYVESKQK